VPAVVGHVDGKLRLRGCGHQQQREQGKGRETDHCESLLSTLILRDFQPSYKSGGQSERGGEAHGLQRLLLMQTHLPAIAGRLAGGADDLRIADQRTVPRQLDRDGGAQQVCVRTGGALSNRGLIWASDFRNERALLCRAEGRGRRAIAGLCLRIGPGRSAGPFAGVEAQTSTGLGSGRGSGSGA
jgi:hypothetical protein